MDREKAPILDEFGRPVNRDSTPVAVHRPSGYICMAGAGDMDPQNVSADTLQCCHCNKHWIVVRGSGKRRGFCMECNRVTCGDKNCDFCYPWEQRLADMAAGRPPKFGINPLPSK